MATIKENTVRKMHYCRSLKRVTYNIFLNQQADASVTVKVLLGKEQNGKYQLNVGCGNESWSVSIIQHKIFCLFGL